MATKNFRVRNGIEVGPTNGSTNSTTIDGTTGNIVTNGTVTLNGSTSGAVVITVPAVSGSSQLTMPAAVDTVVARATTDTLTNKTINGSNNTISNIANSSLVNSSITLGTTNIALGNTSLTPAGLTSVTVTQDPVAAFDLATKQYVDTQVSSGLTFHDPVYCATVVNVTNVAYNQPGGPGVGVGATLTRTGAFATLGIDGTTPPVGSRVLVRLQTTQQWNGVYTVTNVGSPSTGWILTRATDADTYGSGAGQLSLNDYFFVQNGNTQKGIAYVLNAPTGTIVFGTSAITFAEFSSSQVYTGTAPINITGTVISLDTVPIASGGTGQITATAAINALLPSQSGNAGKVLNTDGTNTSWVTNSNTTYTIDATSVSGGADFNLTGSDASVDTVKFASGTGITVSRTDANTITINNTAAPTGVTSITGTANQVIASASTGAVTLSTPQDIAITSEPTFAGATLGSIQIGVTPFTNDTILSTSGIMALISNTITLSAAVDLYADETKSYHRLAKRVTATNNINPVARISLESTGTPTVGFGPSLQFQSEVGVGGNPVTVGDIAYVATDMTVGAENFQLQLSAKKNGATPDYKVYIDSDGNVSTDGNLVLNYDQTAANAVITGYNGATAGTLTWDGTTWTSSNGLKATGSLSNNYFTLPNNTGTNGQVLTSNGSTAPTWTTLATGVTSITGTANQIIASSSTGAVTLSTPQDIATTSAVNFASVTTTGDIAVNGGAITTTAATFNLINTNATTVNIGNAATTASIGATTGTTTVRNALSVTGGNITTTTGSNIISGSNRSYNSIVAQEGRYSGSNDIQRDNNGRASNGFLASNWANLSQSGQRILIRDYQTTATSTPGYNFPASAFATEVSRNASLTSTAASGDGATATLTFAAQTVPPYIVGSSIVVDNIVPTGYRTNVSATVTACTTTTVSYANTTTGAQTVAAVIRGSGAANANDSLMTIYAQPNMGSTNGSGLGDGWSSDNMPYPPGAFRLTASQNQRQTTTATFTAAFANATINAQTTGQMTVSAMTGTSLATTAAAGTGTTATLTFAAQTYIPYAVGSFITVAGVTPTGYNGYYKVTACTTTTVSFANTTTGAQTVAGTTQGAIGVGNEVRSASLTTAAPGSVFIVMRQQSGTPGGAGVYALNVVTGTITSGTVTSLLIQAAQDLLFSTVPANTAVSDVTRFSAFAFQPNSSNLGSNLAVNNLGVTPVFASYVPRYQKITSITTDAVLGDIITIPAHGLRIRDTVIPTTTANGLTATTIYYVQSVTNANQVRLSTTAGGAGLTGLTAGTGLYLEIETTGGYGIGGDNTLALSPTTGRASSILIGTARLGYGQGGTGGNGQKYQGMVSGDELGLLRFSGTAGVVGSTQFQYMYPTQIISSATENYNYTSHGSQTAIQNTRAGQSAAMIVPTNISGNGTTVTVSYTNSGQWFTGQSPFVNGTYITIAGAQPAGYNGTYQIASISATQLTFTSATTGTMIIPGILSQGMVNSIVTNPTSQTYASDVHTFTTAPGSSATAVQTLITANATSTTFTKPVGFPVYTAAAAGAITGAVGQQISISNSPTVGGRMAFWDTTNSRWSYISDNAAV